METLKTSLFFSLSPFQPILPQIDSMSGSSNGDKFTSEYRKKKNMALRREPDESKRRQLDTSAQRRWRAFSRAES